MLAKWTKKEGDKIAPGDVIAEVETDKANMDFPLEDEGVLLKLLVKEGETVKLGAPVAILGEAGEDPAEAMKEIGAAKTSARRAPSRRSRARRRLPPRRRRARRRRGDAARRQPSANRRQPTSDHCATPRRAAAGTHAVSQRRTAWHGRVLASPLARKMALEKGVDLRSVAGSGPRGRIVKRDIDEAAARGPECAGGGDLRRAPRTSWSPPSQMRKTIARRLVEAKREIPHIYLTVEATVDRCSRCASSSTSSAT